jgi:hypothetical protein
MRTAYNTTVPIMMMKGSVSEARLLPDGRHSLDKDVDIDYQTWKQCFDSYGFIAQPRMKNYRKEY